MEAEDQICFVDPLCLDTTCCRVQIAVLDSVGHLACKFSFICTLHYVSFKGASCVFMMNRKIIVFINLRVDPWIEILYKIIVG